MKIKCLECGELTKNSKFCSQKCSTVFNNKRRLRCLNKEATKVVGCSHEGCANLLTVNIRTSAKNLLCSSCVVANRECYYCGKPAKVKLRSGKYCCEDFWSSCPANKDKNSKALKAAYLTGRKQNAGIATEDYAKFRHKKASFIDLYDTSNPIPDEILKVQYRRVVKNVLIKERGYSCEMCGNVEWNSIPITLELEHIDGDNGNNIRSNLKLLCPNCHAQTPTWRRRKK